MPPPHWVPGGIQAAWFTVGKAALARSRGHVTLKPNRGTKNNEINNSFKCDLELLCTPKHL